MEEKLERAMKKQKASAAKIEKLLDRASSLVEAASAGGGGGGEDWQKQLETLHKEVKIATDAALEEHKAYHAVISQLGKAADKKMPPVAKMPQDVQLEQRHVNEMIAHHLFRTSTVEVAEAFAKESGISMTADTLTPLVQMVSVLEAMQSHNLAPALEWAEVNQHILTQRGSTLLFNLHRMQFVQLLKTGKTMDALAYARAHFEKYAKTHMDEIQQLMGCLGFAQVPHLLASSPYAEMFSDRVWTEATTTFAREFCSIVGFAQDSPLALAVEAGCLSLPLMLKFASLANGKTSDWPHDTIPVEVDLGLDFSFHSTFVCPVSREQSTASNPPFMMPCGHVICEHSMRKLARNMTKFKCPYCPTEVLTHQARRVSF